MLGQVRLGQVGLGQVGLGQFRFYAAFYTAEPGLMMSEPSHDAQNWLGQGNGVLGTAPPIEQNLGLMTPEFSHTAQVSLGQFEGGLGFTAPTTKDPWIDDTRFQSHSVGQVRIV